jgi:predicted MFS family arabinose efflux permease
MVRPVRMDAQDLHRNIEMQKMVPASAQAHTRPIWLMVVSAAAIVGISMGLRQVMGLFLPPMTRDLGLSREAFALAMAVANLVWGLGSPLAGAVADKFGTGRVVVVGALATMLGLYLMQAATSEAMLLVSGVLLGIGISGAGISSLVGVVGRNAPPEKRTQAIAAVGMGGGLGVLIALPYTHIVMELLGWRACLVALVITAALMLPLGWPLSGRPTPIMAEKPQSLGEALREAFTHPSFWLLTAGFFVCGFHLAFYGVHLPAYVADLGMPSSVAPMALTLVGISNMIGIWCAGRWGQSLPKRHGLSLIYMARAVVFLGFLFLPKTSVTIIVLSVLLGFLWLSTVPLTSALVATFFGPAWMSMLYGLVFLSHQIGSFLGVWMAGLLFDMTKSYDTMWWLSVGLGVFAALINWPIKEQPVARLAARPAG